MNQQMVGTSPGEGVEVAFRLDDHQMHIERLRCYVPHRLHDDRPDRQVRDKAAIHHVHMDPIGASGLNSPHLLAEPREIGREN